MLSIKCSETLNKSAVDIRLSVQSGYDPGESLRAGTRLLGLLAKIRDHRRTAEGNTGCLPFQHRACQGACAAGMQFIDEQRVRHV